MLGGTVFLGRHVVESALADGHRVTIFSRGRTQPELFPDVERIHGDRDGGMGALAGRRWDAVIDTCGFVPRVVGQSMSLDAGRYVFVSTISAYADLSRPHDESAALLPAVDTEDVAIAYGALKAACERVVQDRFGERRRHRPSGPRRRAARSDRPTHLLAGAHRRGRRRARARSPGRAGPGHRRARPGPLAGPCRVGRRVQRGRPVDDDGSDSWTPRAARSARTRAWSGRSRSNWPASSRGPSCRCGMTNPALSGNDARLVRPRDRRRAATTVTIEETIRDTLAWARDVRGEPPARRTDAIAFEPSPARESERSSTSCASDRPERATSPGQPACHPLAMVGRERKSSRQTAPTSASRASETRPIQPSSSSAERPARWTTGRTSFCERLAAGRRFVIRYDLRDTGQSASYQAGAPPYTGQDFIADALGLLDVFGLAAAHLVGVSGGGGDLPASGHRAPGAGRVAHADVDKLRAGRARDVEPGPAADGREDARRHSTVRRPIRTGRIARGVIDHLIEGERPFAGSLARDAEARRRFLGPHRRPHDRHGVERRRTTGS